MLYVLDESIAELASSGGLISSNLAAMQYLLLSSIEGNHRVWANRSTLRALYECNDFDRREKQAITRLLERVASDGSLKNKLSVYVKVVAHPGIPNSVTENNRRQIQIPLSWFDSSGKIQPTILLGENLSDALVLSKLAECAIVLNGLSFLPVKLRPNHGGGSTIPHVMNHNISNHNFCLCIVDSDKDFPDSPMGTTARSVQHYKNPSLYPLAEVLETRGRDLENSLPNIFYKTSCAPSSQMSKLLCDLTTKSEHELRYFIDIEKGLNLKTFFAMDDPVMKAYWEGKIPTIIKSTGIDLRSGNCTNSGACDKPTNCACVLIKGNSNDILSNFHSQYSATDGHALTSWLDDSVKTEWKELGFAILGWCCGDQPLRFG